MVPTSDVAQRQHLDHAPELGLTTYEEFHAWSIAHRSEFWEAMIRRLGISFRSPYTQVFDPGSDPQHVRWFPSAAQHRR